MADGDMNIKVVVTEGGLGGGSTDKGNEPQRKTADGIGKLGAVIGAVSAGVGKLLDVLLQIVPIGDFLESAMGGITPIASLVAKLLGALIRPLIDLFIPSIMLLALLLMPFVQMMNLLLRPLLVMMMGALTKFAPYYAQIFEGLYSAAEAIGQWIAGIAAAWTSGDMSGVVNMLLGAFSSIAEWIIKGLIGALPQIQEALGKLWNNVKDIKIGDKTLGEWVTQALTWIDEVKTALTGIWDKANEVWNWISGLFQGASGSNDPIGDFFKDAEIIVANVMAAIAEIVLSTANFIKTKFLDGLWTDSEKFAKDMEDLFYNLVANIVNTFIDGFTTIVVAISRAINAIIDMYNSSVGSIPGAPQIGAVDSSGVQYALQSSKMAYRDISRDSGTTVNVTVNGDVSGQELVDKIKSIIENYNRNTAAQIGALNGLSGGG